MIFCFSVKSVYWTVLCESEACAEPKKKLIHFICEESENGGEISSEYRMWLTIKLHKRLFALQYKCTNGSLL